MTKEVADISTDEKFTQFMGQSTISANMIISERSTCDPSI